MNNRMNERMTAFFHKKLIEEKKDHAFDYYLGMATAWMWADVITTEQHAELCDAAIAAYHEMEAQQ